MINSLAIDFIVRIKNGYAASRKSIQAPASNFCMEIAKLLKTNGYIKDYSLEGDLKKTIKVDLQYNNDEPSFSAVKIFSKPGRRIYQKSTALPWGSTNRSLIIVSTSQGVITQREAQKRKVGGEIIAEIY